MFSEELQFRILQAYTINPSIKEIDKDIGNLIPINTGYFAYELNKALRDSNTEGWEGILDYLDSCFPRLRDTNFEPLKVYRGTELASVEPFISDGHLVSPSFLSFSTNQQYAYGQADSDTPAIIETEIYLKSQVIDIDAYLNSDIYEEGEILFQRNQKFQVNEKIPLDKGALSNWLGVKEVLMPAPITVLFKVRPVN